MIKKTFIKLVSTYTLDQQLIVEMWDEIERSYSDSKRYYHTLSHLDNLYLQLLSVKNHIEHFDTLLFSLFYHDIVYNPLKSDNEESSALLAEKRMQQVGVPEAIIENCKAQILATKNHVVSTTPDINYFTDADLSILGQSWDVYSTYINSIRKEYAVYPDLLYKPGRRKVVQHFLSMENIYKTPYFHNKFESQAKENLNRELGMLK